MPPKAADIVEERVLDFINEQNKPVNAQLVADALQKFGMKKTAAQKALDVLTERAAISHKDYGKQRLYLAKQEQFNIPSSEELEAMKKEVDTLQAEVSAAKALASEAEAEVRAINSSLTLEQIRTRCVALQEETARMDQKLSVLKDGSVLVDPEERKKVEQSYNQMTAAWRRRKRMFKDLWETFTEQMDKARCNALREELGIELDEDAGQLLEDHAHLQNKKRKVGTGG